MLADRLILSIFSDTPIYSAIIYKKLYCILC